MIREFLVYPHRLGFRAIRCFAESEFAKADSAQLFTANRPHMKGILA